MQHQVGVVSIVRQEWADRSGGGGEKTLPGADFLSRHGQQPGSERSMNQFPPTCLLCCYHCHTICIKDEYTGNGRCRKGAADAI